MRVKRRRREIGEERHHLPRGLVRLQKAEHTAAAGGEHRRARSGMIDRGGKRFPREVQKPRAFGVAERDALGFRERQRAEQRRRGQPEQRNEKQRRKGAQAEKRGGEQRRAADRAGGRGLRALGKADAQKRGTRQTMREKCVGRAERRHRQKGETHERGGEHARMQQGVRLQQRQHGDPFPTGHGGKKEQKKPKRRSGQHELLQPRRRGQAAETIQIPPRLAERAAQRGGSVGHEGGSVPQRADVRSVRFFNDGKSPRRGEKHAVGKARATAAGEEIIRRGTRFQKRKARQTV